MKSITKTYLLEDTQNRPNLFLWNGAIPLAFLNQWQQEQGFHVPADLMELWATVGGGDFLESETLYSPAYNWATDRETQDNFAQETLEEINAFYHHQGLAVDQLVFHTGTWLSVVLLSAAGGHPYAIVDDAWQTIATFASLDDWYCQTLRREYGDRYRLTAVPDLARRSLI